MSEYSVEEVRARFEAWLPEVDDLADKHLAMHEGEYISSTTYIRWSAWKAAYAERIKADEGVVTDEVVDLAIQAMDAVFLAKHDGAGFYAMSEDDQRLGRDGMRAALFAVWPNPPAQAAQAGGNWAEVNAVADELGSDGGTLHDRWAMRLTAAMPTAEPVAHGEAVAGAPSIEAAEAMGAKGGPAVEAERLAFEAWMKGHCWTLGATWRDGAYWSDAEQGGKLCPHAMQTRGLWAAWRDRAALAAQPRAVPAEIVVPDWKTADVRNEADAFDEEYDLVAITMLRDFADLLDRLAAAPSPGDSA